MWALAVVAVVAVASANAGFSILQSGGRARSAGSDLRFFTHDTEQAWLDLGDKGESLGDRLVFAGDAFDREEGTKVGRLAGSCETVSRDAGGRGETLCSASLDLARGQLMTRLLADTAAFFGGTPLPFAITGGTGSYRQARGDGTITVLNATDARIVIHLD
jgi:allene oxide cyclase-like protein